MLLRISLCLRRALRRQFATVRTTSAIPAEWMPVLHPIARDTMRLYAAAEIRAAWMPVLPPIVPDTILKCAVLIHARRMLVPRLIARDTMRLYAAAEIRAAWTHARLPIARDTMRLYAAAAILALRMRAHRQIARATIRTSARAVIWKDNYCPVPSYVWGRTLAFSGKSDIALGSNARNKPDR